MLFFLTEIAMRRLQLSLPSIKTERLTAWLRRRKSKSVPSDAASVAETTSEDLQDPESQEAGADITEILQRAKKKRRFRS